MPDRQPLRDRLVQLICRAFPDTDPPGPTELLSEGLEARNPFAADELRRFLLVRRWASLTATEIEHHSDWLVYLTSAGFVYYLPAWLLYAMDYMNADYPAQFVLGYLTDPLPRFRDQLTEVQKEVLKAWYDWMGFEYPEEEIPHAPEYITRASGGSPS